MRPLHDRCMTVVRPLHDRCVSVAEPSLNRSISAVGVYIQTRCAALHNYRRYTIIATAAAASHISGTVVLVRCILKY